MMPISWILVNFLQSVLYLPTVRSPSILISEAVAFVWWKETLFPEGRTQLKHGITPLSALSSPVSPSDSLCRLPDCLRQRSIAVLRWMKCRLSFEGLLEDGDLSAWSIDVVVCSQLLIHFIKWKPPLANIARNNLKISIACSPLGTDLT